jgi:ERCC4-related helicase
MNGALVDSSYAGDDVRDAVACLRQKANNQYNFFKWSRLKHHLQDKKERFGDNFRCLVFVQQRIASYILAKAMNDQLSSLDLRAGCVSSRGSKITPSIKVTKSIVTETIQKFREGEVNVLVATSVVEEGIDIPEANVVLLYDPMKDSVELCQRYGRARALESSIVILDERRDRPVELLERVRAIQDTIVNEFDPSTVGINVAEERQKQKGRERTAYQSVLCHEKCLKSPVLALNEYKTKTRASLIEQWSDCDRQFRCTLQYKSILRTLTESADGSSKQEAKTICSGRLLDELKRQTQV